MSIALYGKSRQDHNITGILNFIAEARKAGFRLLCHEKFAAYLTRLGVPEDYIPIVFSDVPDADAAISFGGDGTFLRTARRLGGPRFLSPVSTPGTSDISLIFLLMTRRRLSPDFSMMTCSSNPENR